MKFYVLLIALCLSFTSCQKFSTKNKPKLRELRFNIHSEPPTLDLRRAIDSVSIGILDMCFEGLMSYGLNDEPVPAVAESYEISEDLCKYTFHLRNSVWSDGQPVTASDFEKTWKTMLDPNFACSFGHDLYLLKNSKAANEGRCPLDAVGVKATDPKTLVIELEHPASYFLALLATHSFYAVPAHIDEAFPDWPKEAGPHFVGNGPFRLTVWRHQNEIEVEKNPTYWDKDNVKLDRLYLSMIDDENTELNMFENGELDWSGAPMSSIPLDALKALQQKEKVVTAPIAGTYFYIFNTRSPPFDNVNMRRAFALAINRAEIIENILQSEQSEATGLIPPAIWPETTTYFKDNDVEEAHRLFQLALQEMKIKAEDLPSITLSYNTMQSHHKIAQAIQQQWAKAFGIKVHLANKEWKVFLDELKTHQFQVARMGGLATFNDPVAFLDLYKYEKAGNNYARWVNPRYTELMDQADQTKDPAMRYALLKAAEKVMIDDMPIAPIYFYTATYIKKPHVHGVHLSHMGQIDYKALYVETASK